MSIERVVDSKPASVNLRYFESLKGVVEPPSVLDIYCIYAENSANIIMAITNYLFSDYNLFKNKANNK